MYTYVYFQFNYYYEIQPLVTYQIVYVCVIKNLNWFAFFSLQAKPFPFISLPSYCPSCKQAGVLRQLTTSGVVIVVNEKGSVDSELHILFIEMKTICSLSVP